jgi:hypothetical protein
MKIGIAIERHKNGRWTVRGFGPDSIAAAAGFAAGDEITHVGRTPAKQIRLNEEDGIDFRRGQTVRVLRSGESIRLTIPAREKPSTKYTKIARAIETVDADQLEVLARQVWSCDDLSDGEKQKLGVAIDHRRRALRRGHERELPLCDSPAVGVGPTGNYHHDKEHWRRQIAADTDLSPLARQVANIIEANYISNKVGPNYFCAWPSIKTLRAAVKCASAKVVEAIHEIEACGHWTLKSQGSRKPRLMGLVLRRSERASVLVEPATTAPPTVAQTAAIPQPPAVDENCADGFTSAELDALARGAAISLRPSLHSVADGTAHRRRAEAKPTGREALAEADAQRKAKAERREAAAAREAEINRLCANQARGPLFEAEYDPCGRSSRNSGDHNPFAYRPRPIVGSPIG